MYPNMQLSVPVSRWHSRNLFPWDQDLISIEAAATQLSTQDAASNSAKGPTGPTGNNKTSDEPSALPFDVLFLIFKSAILLQPRTLHLVLCEHNYKAKAINDRSAAVNNYSAPFNDFSAYFGVCWELRERLKESKALKVGLHNTLDFGLVKGGKSETHLVVPPRGRHNRNHTIPKFYFNPNIDTLRLSGHLYHDIFNNHYFRGGTTLPPVMFENVKRLIIDGARWDELEIPTRFPNLEHLAIRFEWHRSYPMAGNENPNAPILNHDGHMAAKMLESRIASFKEDVAEGNNFILLATENEDLSTSLSVAILHYARNTESLDVKKEDVRMEK